MKGSVALFVLLTVWVPCSAQMSGRHQDHGTMIAAGEVRDQAIEVLINPEARVSVRQIGPLPAHVVCNVPITIPIKVTNEAFLTSALEVTLVDDIPPGVIVNLQDAPLTGQPDEIAKMSILLASDELVDVTIAFKARHDSSDLGGRDRIHFLMCCH